MELNRADLERYLQELGYEGNFTEGEMRQLVVDVKKRLQDEDQTLSLFRRTHGAYDAEGPFQRPRKVRQSQHGSMYQNEALEQFGDEPHFEAPSRAKAVIAAADLDNVEEPEQFDLRAGKKQLQQPEEVERVAPYARAAMGEEFAEANLERLADEILESKQYKTYDGEDYVGRLVQERQKAPGSPTAPPPAGVQARPPVTKTATQKTLTPQMVRTKGGVEEKAARQQSGRVARSPGGKVPQSPQAQPKRKQTQRTQEQAQVMTRLQEIAQEQERLYRETELEDARHVLEEMPGYDALTPKQKHQYLQLILDSKLQISDVPKPKTDYERVMAQGAGKPQAQVPRQAQYQDEKGLRSADKPSYQQLTLLQEQMAPPAEENEPVVEPDNQPSEVRGHMSQEAIRCIEREIEIHNEFGLYLDTRGQMRKKRTDPVALNAYYKKCWQLQGAPNERESRIWNAKAMAECEKAYRRVDLQQKQSEFMKAQGVQKPLGRQK